MYNPPPTPEECKSVVDSTDLQFWIDLAKTIDCKQCHGTNYLVECECGCGGIIAGTDKYDDIPRRFKVGHARRGRSDSEEHKRKISVSNSGKLRSPEHCKNISLARMGRFKNKDNPNWKGEKVTKIGLHKRIRATLPMPKTCDYCKLNQPTDVHNISGTYKTDLSDWVWICETCHNRHHKLIDMSNRICFLCGSDKTYIKKRSNRQNRPDWRHINGKLVCRHCYNINKD